MKKNRVPFHHRSGGLVVLFSDLRVIDGVLWLCRDGKPVIRLEESDHD